MKWKLIHFPSVYLLIQLFVCIVPFEACPRVRAFIIIYVCSNYEILFSLNETKCKFSFHATYVHQLEGKSLCILSCPYFESLTTPRLVIHIFPYFYAPSLTLKSPSMSLSPPVLKDRVWTSRTFFQVTSAHSLFYWVFKAHQAQGF